MYLVVRSSLQRQDYDKTAVHYFNLEHIWDRDEPFLLGQYKRAKATNKQHNKAAFLL